MITIGDNRANYEMKAMHTLQNVKWINLPMPSVLHISLKNIFGRNALEMC